MESISQKQRAYLEERLRLLQITDAENHIRLHRSSSDCDDFAATGDYNQTIFNNDKDGNITIHVWDIHRNLCEYDDPNNADPEQTASAKNRRKPFLLTRVSPENLEKQKQEKIAAGEKDFEPAKYKHPAGQSTLPFFHENIIKAYECKTQIVTLILTEGYFKAFKANKHGMPVVGLAGITTATDKQKHLHKDIAEVIRTCNVKNIVMLYDRDCFDISQKAIERKTDLSTRPYSFYSSMLKIIALMKEFDVDVFFARVASEQFPNAKGLDDLLVDAQGLENEIKSDLLAVGTLQGQYFEKLCVTRNTNADKLKRKFSLTRAEDFYENYKFKIGTREFVYFGSTYQCVKEKDGGMHLLMVESKDLQNYMRVGDDFYEIVHRPLFDNIQETEDILVKRQKSTIKMDFGEKAPARIRKFKGFMFYPSHINYQPIVGEFYNLYSEIKHETRAGDWSNIRKLLTHIFEEQIELGLDYIKVLYEEPTHPLPALCLVSKERKTGKSTFLNFLKLLFKENAIICGSDDIQSDFNAHITGKLIVALDEVNVSDNAKTTEKFKYLITAKKVTRNGKGENQIQVDNFTKYIMCSNFETRFIFTQEEETRFWVRKVKPLTDAEDVDMLKRLKEEIPCFLFFLLKRNYSAQRVSRTWFDERLLETEALRKLKDEQRPTPVKLIAEFVKNYFEDFEDEQTLTIDKTRLIENIPELKRYDLLIPSAIENHLHGEKLVSESGKTKTARFKFLHFENDPYTNEMIVKPLTFVGRPWVFQRKDFITK